MKRLIILISAVLMMGCPGKEPIDPPVPNSVSLARPNIEWNDVGGQWVTIETDGEWTASFEFETEEGEAWAFLDKMQGTGEGMIRLTNNTNTLEEVRKVDVVVEFEDGEIKRATLTQNFVKKDKPDNTIYKWTELPKVDTTAGKRYIKHYGTINGEGARNYSMLYDPSMLASLWVAYPIHDCYLGTIPRGNRPFISDPTIPVALQPNLSKSYSPNGNPYERGHQIPYADRNGNNEMGNQTFYWTNMTPQHNALNNGRWKSIEACLRDRVENTSDTMWVVTGAVFKTVAGNETITMMTNQNDGVQIPVPNYYFKVAIMQDGSRYRGIGFWIDHWNTAQYSGTNIVVNAKTIDEIEILTGFDFFVNLSDTDEAEAESNWDASFWRI